MRAATVDARIEGKLRELLEGGPGEIAFHERLPLRAVGRASLGLFLVADAGATGCLVWLGKISVREAPGLLAVATALGLGGAWLAWTAARRLLRARRQPFLVIDSSGLRCGGVAAPIPWSAVADIEVSDAWTFVTSFKIRASAPLSAGGRRSQSIRIDPRGHAVHIWGCAPRGMSRQAYAEILGRALSADRARKALQARAAPRPAEIRADRGVAPEVRL